MASGAGKAKSMENTWSEQDLARHVLKNKKKASAVDSRSPKSSPKVGRERVRGADASGGTSLSSTAPPGRVSGASRGRERLSSTTSTAAASSPLNGRSSEGKKGSRERTQATERKENSSLRERGKDRGTGQVAVGDREGGRQGGRSMRDAKRGEVHGRGREGVKEGGQGTGRREHGGVRESSQASERTRRHGKDSSTREEGGRRGREEGGRRGREEKQDRKEQGGRRGREERHQTKERREVGGRRGREEGGRERALEAASTSSLREREPGAPLVDAIEDTKRELREKQKVKKSGSSDGRIPDGAIPQPMEEVREREGERGGEGEVVEEDFEYEEEFEEDDYNDEEFEEDIEEESESESDPVGNDVVLPVATNSDPSLRINLVEIMQAIDSENKSLREGEEKLDANSTEESQLPRFQLEPSPSGVGSLISRGSVSSQRSRTRKFVDFSSVQKKEEQERVARVTKKRGQELLSMIELDVVTVELLDLQPLSEYELYMHSFGAEGTRQVASQTGEDNAEVEVQTEEVERRERWVQWPPEDLKGYGGPSDDDDDDQVAIAMATEGSSAVRLASFLKRASQVMAVLLEENAAPSGQSPFHSNQSQIPFCTSHTQIRPPPYLQGCTLTFLEYSPTHPHLLMTTHTADTNQVCPDLVPMYGGMVCVWDTREPSQPQYLLACETSPVCGCFSHHKATLIFSGNEDGSVVLWDLREPVAMHTRPPGATPTSQGLVPRSPTFSTAALAHNHNHNSPIVTITPITTSTLHASPLTESNESEETIGLSFQLATLDKSGLLIFWVAVETKPHPQGSESDLGLVPGGRVKLVRSTALDTVRSFSPVSIPVQTLCVRFHPTDTNHLFVGTDEGTIIHQRRYGRRPIPSQYRSQIEPHCPCGITSLQFSPWQPDYFLAGYSNGCISLYNTKKAQPLVTWSESTNGIAIQQVEWAWHHPGSFLVIDSNSTLYLWSLLESDGGPTQTYKRRENTPTILSYRFSPSNSPSPTSPPPSLTLCLSDSSLETHLLTTQPAAATPGDNAPDTLSQQFLNYLQTLG